MVLDGHFCSLTQKDHWGATGLVNGTALLFDFDGVSVIRVERCEDGGSRFTWPRRMPQAGFVRPAGSSRRKALRQPVREISYGERGLEFWWHKRRWWCHEPACAREVVHRSDPAIPAGARLTGRLRSAAGRRDTGRRLHGHPGRPRIRICPGRPRWTPSGPLPTRSSKRRCPRSGAGHRRDPRRWQHPLGWNRASGTCRATSRPPDHAATLACSHDRVCVDRPRAVRLHHRAAGQVEAPHHVAEAPGRPTRTRHRPGMEGPPATAAQPRGPHRRAVRADVEPTAGPRGRSGRRC